MLENIVGYLRCPVCRADLAAAGQIIRCDTGHSFDVSSHGYVNLLGGDKVASADTAAMVEARDTFLRGGYFDSLAGSLAAISERCAGAGCVLDVGGGTGYYLTAMLRRTQGRAGIVLDSSKYAARRAARAHPRIGAVVADTWQTLPIRDGASAVVLNVFAPRNAGEFHRVLHSDGSLIVVTPTTQHLQELVGALGLLTVDRDKESRLSDQLGGHFAPVDTKTHVETMELSADAVKAVIAMGPSSHHVDAAALHDRIDRLPEPVAVTMSVTISTYQKR